MPGACAGRRAAIASCICVVALVAGCTRNATDATPAGHTVLATPSPPVVWPSGTGTTPSASAKMICAPEALADIAASLGIRPVTAPVPTWADHTYSCPVRYPGATLLLSVTELPDAAATTGYYTGMRDRHPGGGDVPYLGDAAYLTPNGSALTRKDFKVLWVDVSGLPAQIGTAPVPRSAAGYRVAIAIMGCWTGA
jgi:hypothetical protein